VRFLARFLEDFGDEALWRPALYYRWAFADDARLLSGRLARGMLRDVPGPVTLRRWFILNRQRYHYIRNDGITAATRPAVERLYRDTLTAMSAALQTHPFVLGARPTEADFGLFASMFRHFFCDPTPARIMRNEAPRVMAWVSRLWALHPDAFAGASTPTCMSPGVAPLVSLAATVHLPYLAANAAAWSAGRPTVAFEQCGARFRAPVNPYRVWCLAVLQDEYAALAGPEQAMVATHLGTAPAAVLAGPRVPNAPRVVAGLPIRAATAGKPVGPGWQ